VRKTILRLSLLFGLALFAAVIWRSGPTQILAALGRLSAAQILALAALRAVYWVVRTACWKQVFDCYESKRPFYRLFEARLADNAIGFLTPSAMLGGLPVRAMMLDGLDRRRIFASVVLDKTIEIITLAFYSVLAMAAAVVLLPMTSASRLAFGVFIVLATVICAALVAGQRRGFFSGFFDRLARFRIRPRWADRNRELIRDIDAAIADFYRTQRAKFSTVAALYTLSFLIWAMEIHVTLLFFGASNPTVLKSLLIISLGNVALLLPTVPASLGVYEVTNVGIFALLGWPAGLAVAVAVIRRLLALAWTAAGLAALFWRQRRLKIRGKEAG
jgi:uncharacterized protein (TIRG00374 family)